MPSVSRHSHKVKEIACHLTTELLTKTIGEKIEIQLKNEKIVWERVE